MGSSSRPAPASVTPSSRRMSTGRSSPPPAAASTARSLQPGTQHRRSPDPRTTAVCSPGPRTRATAGEGESRVRPRVLTKRDQVTYRRPAAALPTPQGPAPWPDSPHASLPVPPRPRPRSGPLPSPPLRHSILHLPPTRFCLTLWRTDTPEGALESRMSLKRQLEQLRRKPIVSGNRCADGEPPPEPVSCGAGPGASRPESHPSPLRPDPSGSRTHRSPGTPPRRLRAAPPGRLSGGSPTRPGAGRRPPQGLAGPWPRPAGGLATRPPAPTGGGPRAPLTLRLARLHASDLQGEPRAPRRHHPRGRDSRAQVGSAAAPRPKMPGPREGVTSRRPLPAGAAPRPPRPRRLPRSSLRGRRRPRPR